MMIVGGMSSPKISLKVNQSAGVVGEVVAVVVVLVEPIPPLLLRLLLLPLSIKEWHCARVTVSTLRSDGVPAITLDCDSGIISR